MPDIIVLSAKDVAELLSMTDCMDAMDAAPQTLSEGNVAVPLRSFTPLPDDRGFLAMMPAAAAEPPVFGIKNISLLPDNPAMGRPMIQGFIALFDHESGAPCAIIDGVSVTAIRTAAASGVATRALARDDTKTHGIFGTGIQAVTHAETIAVACPQLRETRIWGRDFSKAQALAAQISKTLDIAALAVEERADAANYSVISAVTASAQPLIKQSDVRPGAHINLVGSHTPDKREADSRTIASARLYVDGRDAALSKAGDIVMAMNEGAITPAHILAELGSVLAGKADGRMDHEDITIYKSLGNAAQDLFAAWHVYEKAQRLETGQKVTL